MKDGELCRLPPGQKHAEEQLQHHQLFEADAPFQNAELGTGIFRQWPFLQLLLGLRQVKRQFAHLDIGGERTG
ncbi:hypothetical protein D3C71_1617060 [compost metagenome]